MAIGFRLGPARIGINRGRVTGGVTLGPVSASTTLAGARRSAAVHPVYPDTAEQLVAQAEAEGFRVVSRTAHLVRVERGWRAAVIATVQGGTQVRPALSSLGTWAVVGLCVAPIALLLLAAAL